ncbi:MAG: hypothetical protein OXE17_06980 [Chloroflexi bacterium]|nr:hypothetical protein [Chloroflexota bacterium]
MAVGYPVAVGYGVYVGYGVEVGKAARCAVTVAGISGVASG